MRSNRGAKRGGIAGLGALKGFLIIIVLGGLSFGVGFFVIARMLPGNQPPESSEGESLADASKSAAATNPNFPAASHPIPRAMDRARRDSGAAAPAPRTRLNGPGPSVDPAVEADTQQPTTPETNNGPIADRSAGIDQPLQRATDVPAVADGLAAVPRSAHHSRRRRRHRATVQPPTDIQSPKSPDSDTSGAQDGSSQPGAQQPDSGAAGGDSGTPNP